jgi:isopentenyl phosphate kinase
MKDLIFLKLGGSLITDKDQAHTALIPRIDSLAKQIHEFLEHSPSTRILIGHGSGSFGHYAANKFGTRHGVKTAQEWQGFTEVWYEARSLNQIVIERLHRQGLKVVSFPLSASAETTNQQLSDWEFSPIEQSLQYGLLPVIYGDVVLDKSLGGTILSTEEQFAFLAGKLHPSRILLAGIEPGIWQDFPVCTTLLKSLSKCEYSTFKQGISGSISVDVTGGMTSKVKNMFAIIEENPEIKIQIFSGLEPGTLLRVLKGESIGTVLTA